MTDLTVFQYADQRVRTIVIDGEPWFVLNDLCAVLAIGNSRMVVTRLDPSGVSQTDIRSGGQMRRVTVVNEAGMYEVVIRSDKPEAVAFRRWITSEVLPQIRKTGSYGAAPALAGPELIAKALIEASEILAAKDEQIAQLAPAADAWGSYLSSTGDYSVNEAAKILSRDHNVLTGERRLRSFLEEIGWIYRHSGEPRASQAQVDLRRMAEKASFYFHPESGEKITKTPQVRITPKGIDALRKRLVEPQLELTARVTA